MQLKTKSTREGITKPTVKRSKIKFSTFKVPLQNPISQL